MDKLDKILDRYDETLERSESLQKKAESRDQELKEEFQAIVEEKIIPAMEKAKTKLESRGHKVEISRWGELVFEFHPKGADFSRTTRTSIPHFSFDREGDQAVRYMCRMKVGGGGQAGRDGKYPFSEFSEELVQNSVVDIVEYALEPRARY